MKMYATQQDIFEGKEIVFDDEDMVYRCPVCHKEYKNLDQAKKHFEKKNCSTVQDMVRDFPIENTMHRVYEIIFDTERSSLEDFRKTRFYEGIAKFCANCIDLSIEPTNYATFLKAKLDSYRSFMILNTALDNHFITAYRKFLISNPSLIDSEHYYNTYRQKFDILPFIVYSLENALISWDYIKQTVDHDRMKAIYREASFADRMTFDTFIHMTGQRHGL